MPKLGASDRRTLRGTIVSKTASPRWLRTSAATSEDRFVRASNIVRTTPLIASDGLRLSRTRLSVAISWDRPASAEEEHCVRITTESDDVRALTVSRPRDGGQS